MGITAYTLGAALGPEGVRPAGSGGSNGPMRAEVSTVVSATASRVPTRLGGSEDAWVAVSFPAAASSATGGGGMAAPTGVISPTGIGLAPVATAGLETAPAAASG
jgi:hypothetical protein